MVRDHHRERTTARYDHGEGTMARYDYSKVLFYKHSLTAGACKHEAMEVGIRMGPQEHREGT